MPTLYTQQGNNLSVDAPNVPDEQNVNIGGAVEQVGGAVAKAGQSALYAQGLQNLVNGRLWTDNTIGNLNISTKNNILKKQSDPAYINKPITQDTLNEYDYQLNQAINNAPNNTARYLLQKKGALLRTQIGNETGLYDNKVSQQYQFSTLANISNQNITLATADNANRMNYLSDTLHSIDIANIPNVLKEKYKAKAISDFTNQLLNYDTLKNPSVLMNQINNYVGSKDNNHISGAIRAAADKYGIDPLTMGAISTLESNNNVNAQNPNSSAYGAFQMTKDTAKALGADLSTPQGQADAEGKLLAQSTKQLKNAGLEVSPATLMLVHRFGIDKAKEMLKNDISTPLSDVLSDDIIKNNNLEGQTIGSYLDKLHNDMSTARGAHDYPDYFNATTYPQLRSAYFQAEKLAKQQGSAYRGQFEQVIHNQLLNANNGIPITNIHTRDEFNNVYGNAMGEVKYNNYIDAVNVNQLMRNFSGMSQVDVMKHLDDTKQAAADGKVDGKYLDSAIKAVNTMNNKLKTDPVDYYQKFNPVIQNDYSLIQNALKNGIDPSQLYNKYYGDITSLNKLTGGINNIETKSAIDNDINTLNNQSTNIQQFLQSKSNQYGDFFPQYMNQINNSKAIKNKSLLSIPYLSQADGQLVANASSNYNQNILQLGGKQKVDLKSFDQTILNSDAYKNFKYSVPTGNEGILDSYRDAITKLAIQYEATGVTSGTSDSVKLANNIITNNYNYVKNGDTGYYTRIPKNVSMDNLSTEQGKALNGSFAIPRDISPESFASLLKNQPVWITNHNETGTDLYVKGYDGLLYPVIDGKSKTQVSVPFDNNSSFKMITNNHVSNVLNDNTFKQSGLWHFFFGTDGIFTSHTIKAFKQEFNQSEAFWGQDWNKNNQQLPANQQ